MKTQSRRSLAAALAVLVFMGDSGFALQTATIGVGKIKDLSIRMYGFVETDVIADTTAGFTEEMDSNLVPMRTAAGGGGSNFSGQTHRTEMSIRNSRLGFALGLPKSGGLSAKAVLELDFMGNNAPNTAPGSAPGAQSERDFFNNPAVRVRHAYLDLDYDGLDGKIGQYWSLLGWQPYYFPGEAVLLPSPAMLYRRFAQVRAAYAFKPAEGWTLQAAADLAKPAQMNSGSPEPHAGLRLASTKTLAASVSGSGTSMVGLSLAASGALIPLHTQSIGSPTGSVYALDFAVPLIASRDGVDRSNNLIWMGEFVAGQGLGGLEMAGLTFGVPGISAATPNAGSAIDSGIAGLNLDGNAELIQSRSWRTHLQYCLPGGKWAVSAGYAQAEARNLDRFSTAKLAPTLAPKIQFGYLSAFYDPVDWLRFAAEINQNRTTYNDAANRFAVNNRYQFTTFFLF